jgi:hypothetical protein
MSDPLGLFESQADSDPLGLFKSEGTESPGFIKGAIGTGAAMADIVAGIPKIGTRAALAVGGKIAEPSRSLQDTWDTAGQAVEETFPSFGKDMGDNPGYTVPMKPFELYGKGAEWVAKNASFGNKDVEGAINIGANFLPIPFAGHAAKGLGKVAEAVDPALRNAEYTKPLDLQPVAVAAAPEAPKSYIHQMEIDTTPTEAPFVGGTGGGIPRGADMRVDENGIPIRADLSMEAQNLGQPLQRNLWGDELPAKSEQEAPLGITQALDTLPPGKDRSTGIEQLGGVPLGKEQLRSSEVSVETTRLPSGTQMGHVPPKAVELPDSIEKPTTPETITKRAEIRAKVDASSVLKKIAPEYSSITTPEEAIALSKDSKDINWNPARDVTISGINGQVMLHRNNPALNFTRYSLQEARNIATKFSKDFITNDEGVATLTGKLRGNDLVSAMNALTDAARDKVNLTPENIKALNLLPHVEKAVLSVRKALQEQYLLASGRGRMEVGRSPFVELPGYMPGLMTGGYKSLIGVMKDGVFVTKAIAQADTRWGHQKAVEAFKQELMKKGETPKVLPTKRQSLKQSSQRNSLFNGFNDVINTIAKNDPRFAELQQAAMMKANQANHTLMNFNVHEMDKKGIRGVVGDSPIRTRLQNAVDLRKGLVEFLEQGADYYAHQSALEQINKVITDPNAAHLENTRSVIEKHVKHVTGQDINPIGNAANWAIDSVFKMVGVSGKVPLGAVRELRTLVGLHMMSIFNPIFTALQYTQVVTSAIPEMAKVSGKLGIQEQASKSASIAPMQFAALVYAKQANKEPPPSMPAHMKEAFKYAQDHGIMSFSELENAQKASRNQALVKAENLAAWNIVLGEKGTRPPVFMTFADIFHKFGLTNEEAFMAAHHTTNMAMGDYHQAERPHIYSQLGVVGEFGGALTTFKHNILTNYWIKGKDAAVKDHLGNRQLAPAIIALIGVGIFQGIKGGPGYDDINSIVQWATGMLGERKDIGELALDDAPNWLNHGLLSAATGLDFQSRSSMARILPETQWSSFSPQMSVVADIGVKAYQYGQYKDQQSFNELMRALTPSGLRGITEDALMMDDQHNVYNPAGELMPEQPRDKWQAAWRKYGAVRPLKEAQDSQDVYLKSKSLRDEEDALNTIAHRYRQAFAAGDQKGMDNLAQMYYDKDGDPLVLEDAAQKQMQVMRSNQTQRERMAGMLQASIRSIKRHGKLDANKR